MQICKKHDYVPPTVYQGSRFFIVCPSSVLTQQCPTGQYNALCRAAEGGLMPTLRRHSIRFV